MGNSFSSKKAKSSKHEEKLSSSVESLDNANSQIKSKKKRKKKSVKEEGNSQTGIKKKLSFSKKFQEKPSKKKKKRDKKSEKEKGEYSDEKSEENKFPKIIISSPSDVEASIERDDTRNSSHAPITHPATHVEPQKPDVTTEKVSQTVVEAEVGKFTKNTSSNNCCNNSTEIITPPVSQIAVDNKPTSSQNSTDVVTTNPDSIDPITSLINESSEPNAASQTATSDSNPTENNICSITDANNASDNETDEELTKTLPSVESKSAALIDESRFADSAVCLLLADIIEQILNRAQTEKTEVEKLKISKQELACEPHLSTLESQSAVNTAEKSEVTPTIETVTEAVSFGIRSDLTLAEITTPPTDTAAARTENGAAYHVETITMPNNDIIVVEEFVKVGTLAAKPNETAVILKDDITDAKTVNKIDDVSF